MKQTLMMNYLGVTHFYEYWVWSQAQGTEGKGQLFFISAQENGHAKQTTYDQHQFAKYISESESRYCPSGVKSWHSFRAPEWHSGLRHCISVLDASLQSLVRFQAVSQLDVIGSSIEQHTIGPASSGIGFLPL